MDEMKQFFMKHYNNSSQYSEQLQMLNLRNREKDLRKDQLSGQGIKSSKSVGHLRALKKSDYEKHNL